MILALLLAGLLCFSLLLNFSAFFDPFGDRSKTGRQSGRVLEEVMVENNRSPHKIVVIDVEGIITSQSFDRTGRNMVDLIADQFKSAARDKSVKAVILKVDSPGGEVMASDNIARAIAEFQETSGKPVLAAMGGLGASGGYYVSAPCEWIVANELTITGSIGVILQTFNYRELMDKIGLHPHVFKSGELKDMLRGSKRPEEIRPEEFAIIQQMVDATYLKFKEVVAQGRERANKSNGASGRVLVQDWEQYADGRVLTGKQAFDLGFIDELGTFQTAVERTKSLAEIEDANIIRYQEPFDLSRLFRLFGQSEPVEIKVDLGFDRPKLEAGRLYFLSSSLIH
jgi:protease IV